MRRQRDQNGKRIWDNVPSVGGSASGILVQTHTRTSRCTLASLAETRSNRYMHGWRD